MEMRLMGWNMTSYEHTHKNTHGSLHCGAAAAYQLAADFRPGRWEERFTAGPAMFECVAQTQIDLS